VNPNAYNVDLDKAASLWTASIQADNTGGRAPGVPFLDSKSKNYFVDDESFLVSREGGLGMELLELAGGREDGYGITIVENVSGNAAAAGILPGDSLAAFAPPPAEYSFGSDEIPTENARGVECRDFDETVQALSFPPEVTELVVSVKRMRRWPKVQVRVEYPPKQCAEGVDNVVELELFAGENLQRALLNRQIVMDDPQQPKCDFCGHNYCTVSIEKGDGLLNPKSIMEEKRMSRNPRCRISCKTTVGYNMQEGDLKLRINLFQWGDDA